MSQRRGWPWVLVLAAAALPADTGKRVQANGAAEKRVAAAALAGGGVAANITLVNGVTASFALAAQSVPARGYAVFNQANNNGFQISVPAGATRLDILVQITTPGVDLDLFVRRGSDVAIDGSGRIVMEYASTGTTSTERITIVPCPGTFFIALALYNPETTAQSLSASGAITATYDSSPFATGAALTSGTPLTFSFGAVSTPTLFNATAAYRIDVPAGAARLAVSLQTLTPSSSIDLDLYVRYGCDVTVAGGAVNASFESIGATGAETIEITPASTPPLSAGTYYVAIAVLVTNVPTSGTITATVTGGGGSGGGGGGAGTCPAGSGPNLITNGSFEQAGGASGALGWSLVSGTVDRWSAWTASDGTWSMDLDGSSFGAIAQGVSTTPGTTYTVLFDLAGNPGGPPTIKRLRVSAASTSSTYEFNITGRTTGAMGWRAETFCFPATAASTTLEFRSLDVEGGFWGPAIDNVRVQAVGGGAGGGGSGFGTNLLANPGAEGGAAQFGCNRAAGSPPPSGWTDVRGRMSVCAYGDTSFGGPTVSQAPPNAGPNFFNGGFAGNSAISQTVDVSSQVSKIDAGQVRYELSAYLGGFVGDDDHAALRAEFRNAGGASLGSAVVGPVRAADRASQTRFIQRSTSGPVPAGTRRIEVTLEATLVGGSSNDGYADLLSLVLTQGSGGGGGGSGAPVLSASPRLDFGTVNVNESRDLGLTIRNTGTAGLTIGALNSSNPTEFVVLGPPTPFDIAAGGQRDVMLRFRPSAGGGRSSTLTISSNDPNRPSTTIDLSGTGGGGTGPVLTASVSTLSFTAQTRTNPPSQTFTLRNTSSIGSLTYLITSSQSWLSARPSSGTLQTGQSTTISADVNVAGLAAGTYDANLRVTLPVGARTPTVEQAFQLVITVRLTIQAGGGGGSCPAGPLASPLITAGAVVNAASFVNSALPGGAIGRGGIFSLFGRNLGPTQLVTATRFPLALDLGCVSVKVTLGSTTVDAIPLAAIETQINAIMPSNAPLGEATITVTFNGRTGAAQRVRIVESSFGFFTVNQSGSGPAIVQNFESQTSVPPLNSPRRPLRRGQVGIAYGSGLGGIPTADNQPAPGGDPRVSVELLIGNKRAIVEYAGRTPGFAALDQINFITPDDAPFGCYVPMVARIGGVTTNTVTIAISDDPSRCSDPANPFAALSGGGKVGSLQMIRLNARLQLDATANFTNIDVDVGTGLFVEAPPSANEFAYNPLVGLPPVGSCSVFSAGGIDLSGLLEGQLPGSAQANARVLNAGPALQVSGPRGNKTLPRSTDFNGAYFNILGGAIPLLGPPPQPLYLDAGEYTVTGPGGPDVGPFTARFRVPPSFTWSNRDAVAQSTRANGVTFNWTGGDPSNSGVILLGGNLDQPTSAGAVFVCFAEFASGTFTVPGSITGALPPSNLQRPDQTIGFLAIGAGTPSNLSTFTATGIDQAYAFFLQFNVLSVVWR